MYGTRFANRDQRSTILFPMEIFSSVVARLGNVGGLPGRVGF